MFRLETKEQVINKLIECFEKARVINPTEEGFIHYDKFDEESDQFYFAFANKGFLEFEIHCCPWGFQHSTCGLKIRQYDRADLYFKDGIKSPALTYVKLVPTLTMYLEALVEFINTHEQQIREKMNSLYKGE